MIISKKKYEAALQKAREEEAERFCRYEQERENERRRKEFEDHIGRRFYELGVEKDGFKREIFRSLADMDRRIRQIEGCACGRGQHEQV